MNSESIHTLTSIQQISDLMKFLDYLELHNKRNPYTFEYKPEKTLEEIITAKKGDFLWIPGRLLLFYVDHIFVSPKPSALKILGIKKLSINEQNYSCKVEFEPLWEECIIKGLKFFEPLFEILSTHMCIDDEYGLYILLKKKEKEDDDDTIFIWTPSTKRFDFIL